MLDLTWYPGTPSELQLPLVRLPELLQWLGDTWGDA